jgi:hypothetical protein
MIQSTQNLGRRRTPESMENFVIEYLLKIIPFSVLSCELQYQCVPGRLIFVFLVSNQNACQNVIISAFVLNIFKLGAKSLIFKPHHPLLGCSFIEFVSIFSILLHIIKSMEGESLFS